MSKIGEDAIAITGVYVMLLSHMDRLRAAVTAGSWHQAWEASRALTRIADQMAATFTRPGTADTGQRVMGYHEPSADAAEVATLLHEMASTYHLVPVLHPAPAAPEPLPGWILTGPLDTPSTTLRYTLPDGDDPDPEQLVDALTHALTGLDLGAVDRAWIRRLVHGYGDGAVAARVVASWITRARQSTLAPVVTR